VCAQTERVVVRTQIRTTGPTPPTPSAPHSGTRNHALPHTNIRNRTTHSLNLTNHLTTNNRWTKMPTARMTPSQRDSLWRPRLVPGLDGFHRHIDRAACRRIAPHRCARLRAGVREAVDAPKADDMFACARCAGRPGGAAQQRTLERYGSPVGCLSPKALGRDEQMDGWESSCAYFGRRIARRRASPVTHRGRSSRRGSRRDKRGLATRGARRALRSQGRSTAGAMGR